MKVYVLISGNTAPLSGCEFKNSKVKPLMIATSQNLLYLPHVPRLCYMRRSACATHSLTAPLFLEQNIKHFVGPDLGPNCLLN